MDEYEISDYGIFNDAISTTNSLNNSISNFQTICFECKSAIENDAIFMGPIADVCGNSFGDLDVDMTTLTENFSKINEYLIETANIYKSGDALATSTILNLDNTSETKITTLNGSSNDDKIWNYLVDKGFSAAGVAGIMGNLQQESGLLAGNVQNGMGYSDEDYVNGIKSGKISRESFINDSRGFGIAQWTYPTRKAALYDTLGPENIDSLSGQLDFMYDEMSDDLKQTLKSAESTKIATDTFHDVYEKSASKVLTERENNASKFYDKFTTGS